MATKTKFFIPKAKDDAQAEEVWESVKKFSDLIDEVAVVFSDSLLDVRNS